MKHGGMTVIPSGPHRCLVIRDDALTPWFTSCISQFLVASQKTAEMVIVKNRLVCVAQF
jgi:hypothetical protein